MRSTVWLVVILTNVVAISLSGCASSSRGTNGCPDDVKNADRYMYPDCK